MIPVRGDGVEAWVRICHKTVTTPLLCGGLQCYINVTQSNLSLSKTGISRCGQICVMSLLLLQEDRYCQSKKFKHCRHGGKGLSVVRYSYHLQGPQYHVYFYASFRGRAHFWDSLVSPIWKKGSISRYVLDSCKGKKLSSWTRRQWALGPFCWTLNPFCWCLPSSC